MKDKWNHKNKISNEDSWSDKKDMEVNESAAHYAVLVAFDLVLLSWSLLHALTLSSLVFRVFKCFWDTRGEGTDKWSGIAIDPEGNIV